MMAMINNDRGLARAALHPAGPAATGFVENTAAAFDAALLGGRTDSMTFALGRAYDEYIRRIKVATGVDLANPIHDGPAYQDARAFRPGAPVTRENRRFLTPNSREREARFFSQVQSLAEQRRHGDVAGGFFDVLSPEQVREELAPGFAQEAEARRDEIAAHADGFGVAGQFAGEFGAIATDPVVLPSLFFGAGAASGVIRTVLMEAAVGGASEAVAQAFVQPLRAELGLDHGPGQAAGHVATAALGGGVFGGAVKLAGMGAGRLIGLARASGDPAARDAASVLERSQELREANPLPDDAVEEHARRFDAAAQAVAAGRLPDDPDAPGASGAPDGAGAEGYASDALPGPRELAAIPADNDQAFVSAGGARFLANQDGGADFGSAPDIGGAGKTLPIRFRRDSITGALNRDRAREDAAALGYAHGVELAVDVANNWTHAYRAGGGERVLLVLDDGRGGELPGMVVSARAGGDASDARADYANVISVGKRRPDQVAEAELLTVREPDPEAAAGAVQPPGGARPRIARGEVSPAPARPAGGLTAAQAAGLEDMAARSLSDLDAEQRVQAEAGELARQEAEGFEQHDRALAADLERLAVEDADLPVPVGIARDAEGNAVLDDDGNAVTAAMRVGALRDEIEAGQAFLRELDICAGGGETS